MNKILNPFRAIAFVSALALFLAATPAYAAQYVNVNGVAGPTGMIASCTASARAVADVCPGDPWQIGSGGNLDCWTLATPPSCSGVNGTNNVFMCDGLGQDLPSHCTCAPNMIKCGTNCQLPFAPAPTCAAGQSYNACTGVCSGNVNVQLQTNPPTRQGSAVTPATISIFGDLDMTGNLVVGGTSTNTGLVTFNGGLTFPAGAGLGKILTSDAAGIATWQTPAASGVGGSGTVNTLPKFTAGSTLGNSLVSDNGTTVTVTGAFSTTGVTTLGNAVVDTVTANSGGWTFPNSTTVALKNSANAINFDANTLTIDALNNRVGIGTAAPTVALDVLSGSTTAEMIVGVTQLGNYAGYANFQHKDSAEYGILQNAAGKLHLNSTAGQATTLRVGNSEVMSIAAGTVTITGGLTASGDLVSGDDVSAADDIIAAGGYNGSGGLITFNNLGTTNDTSFEHLAFMSGATRQGVILYDGAWGSCNSSVNEFCIRAENSNALTLAAEGYVYLKSDADWIVAQNNLWVNKTSDFDGAVQMDSNLNVSGTITSNSYVMQTSASSNANGTTKTGTLLGVGGLPISSTGIYMVVLQGFIASNGHPACILGVVSGNWTAQVTSFGGTSAATCYYGIYKYR